MEQVLPSDVVVVEHRGKPLPAPLFPEEEAAVARAVPARRTEYAAVRACARVALTRLGPGPVAVPSGRDRAPIWPSGVVGSMTHCDGYRAAAVAHGDSWAGIGIDAEVLEPLPAETVSLIMSDAERDALAGIDPALCPDRMLFSAKESVYKVWSPIMHSWLGFEHVDVRIDDGTFTARLRVSGLGTDVLHGRWAVGDALVVTAVAIPRA
ncbi:4'-phosphopantetheinyl transferase [Cellulomonas sp. URHE0023]|uniref:4'-phosphopantetheinyl transferase family protein n=1 Tax=Cellulomonas sp. URHE0023 TaxID=1380354 RepID=UPI001E41769F|nr:4'-phosphopantetheinyl transferase superfamily protein [Cellulomonas sp. URHE0023]